MPQWGVAPRNLHPCLSDYNFCVLLIRVLVDPSAIQSKAWGRSQEAKVCWRSPQTRDHRQERTTLGVLWSTAHSRFGEVAWELRCGKSTTYKQSYELETQNTAVRRVPASDMVRNRKQKPLRMTVKMSSSSPELWFRYAQSGHLMRRHSSAGCGPYPPAHSCLSLTPRLSPGFGNENELKGETIPLKKRKMWDGCRTDSCLEVQSQEVRQTWRQVASRPGREASEETSPRSRISSL